MAETTQRGKGLLAENLERVEAGDAVGAAKAYEELPTAQLRVLGPDHPDTLTTCCNLASLRGEAGDAAGAVEIYEEVVTAQLRVLGPDHPDTLGSRDNLAYWWGGRGCGRCGH